MTTTTVSIRRARAADAGSLSAIFDDAWREAYQGVIPGIALERFLARRGPETWRDMIGGGRGFAVIAFGERIAGYAAYGRARDRAMRADGEIDELYIAPEFQGLGLGTRLFRAVRNDLIDRGLTRIGVWALADNARACGFYEGLGGVAGPESVERVSGFGLPKIGYLFT